MTYRLCILARRFIPAGAGNTQKRIVHLAFSAVHPRGRGEHGGQTEGGPIRFGSSPRARGTRHSTETSCPTGRFIPAGAGNTFLVVPSRPRIAVHPRGRGEHHIENAQATLDSGSSPRARGTRRGHRLGDRRDRFIPAGAGNTSHEAHDRQRWPVHPRGRGEHSSAAVARPANGGSSPRARGTLPAQAVHGTARRFIPAGAGNTRSQSPSRAGGTVHPRGRGEHTPKKTIAASQTGSSPRARGTRVLIDCDPQIGEREQQNVTTERYEPDIVARPAEANPVDRHQKPGRTCKDVDHSNFFC